MRGGKSWRAIRSHCLILALLLPAAMAGRAAAEGPTYPIDGGRSVGETVRVEARLEVGGDLVFSATGPGRKSPMSVVADLVYDEKLLAAGDRPRAVRLYERAEATIKIGKQGHSPSLSESRRLLLVEAGEVGVATIFSPSEPLTREELDLVGHLGSTLWVDRLLPGRPVAVGESWTHGPRLLEGLLGLETVSQSEVTSRLVTVQERVALMEVAGTLHGVVDGTITRLEVEGRYSYDIGRKQVARISLAVKEARDAGHVGPGVDVVARLTLKLRPVAEPAALRSEQLGKLTEATAETTRLALRSESMGFKLDADRRWYATNDQPSLLVLRLLDQGDLLAQCNVEPLARRSPARHLSLAEYQREIRRALGDRFGQMVQAVERTDAAGQRIYRVVARGQVQKVPIEWRYYLLAHPSGRRVALVFMIEKDLVERFNQADTRLVEGLRLTPAATAAARADGKRAAR